MVGKSKYRRRTTDGLQFFCLVSDLLIKFKKTTVLQGNRREIPEIYRNMVGDRMRGVYSFPIG
jgi:hypothetical protein